MYNSNNDNNNDNNNNDSNNTTTYNNDNDDDEKIDNTNNNTNNNNNNCHGDTCGDNEDALSAGAIFIEVPLKAINMIITLSERVGSFYISLPRPNPLSLCDVQWCMHFVYMGPYILKFTCAVECETCVTHS